MSNFPTIPPQIISLTFLIFFVVVALCYQVAKYTEAKVRKIYEEERDEFEAQFKSYREKYYDLERSWNKINNRAEIRLERARACERRAEKFRSLYEQCCKEKESLYSIAQNLTEEHRDEAREELYREMELAEVDWGNFTTCDNDGSYMPPNVIDCYKDEE